jgi:hypothetical protein
MPQKKNSSSSKEERISLKLYGNGWTPGEAHIITTCEVVAEIVDPKNIYILFFLQRGPNEFEVIWKWVDSCEAQIITTRGDLSSELRYFLEEWNSLK